MGERGSEESRGDGEVDGRVAAEYLPAVLEHLDLSHNSIKDVPMEVFRLRNLQHFDVSYNELSSLMGPIYSF